MIRDSRWLHHESRMSHHIRPFQVQIWLGSLLIVSTIFLSRNDDFIPLLFTPSDCLIPTQTFRLLHTTATTHRRLSNWFHLLPPLLLLPTHTCTPPTLAHSLWLCILILLSSKLAVIYSSRLSVCLCILSSLGPNCSAIFAHNHHPARLLPGRSGIIALAFRLGQIIDQPQRCCTECAPSQTLSTRPFDGSNVQLTGSQDAPVPSLWPSASHLSPAAYGRSSLPCS